MGTFLSDTFRLRVLRIAWSLLPPSRADSGEEIVFKSAGDLIFAIRGELLRRAFRANRKRRQIAR
jgi:hypothetical protein